MAIDNQILTYGVLCIGFLILAWYFEKQEKIQESTKPQPKNIIEFIAFEIEEPRTVTFISYEEDYKAKTFKFI